MRLMMDKSTLQTAAATAATVAKYAKDKAVLSCLKLVAGERVEVSATDLETGVRLTLPAAVEAPGVAVVHAKTVADWLKLAPAGEVSLHREGTTLRLAAGRSRADLPLVDAKTFPDAIPALPAVATVQFPDLTAVLAALRRVEFATGSEIRGFILTGVLFDVAAGRVTLVATDSTHLSTLSVPAETDGTGSFLVRPDGLRGLGGLGDGAVTARFSTGTVAFSAGPDELCTRLVEGRYPPWGKILESCRKPLANAAKVPLAVLAAAVRQACVTEDDTTRLECSFSPGLLVLASQGDGASGRAEVDLPDYAGPAVDVALDSRRLRAFLGAAAGAKVADVPLTFGKAGQPVVADVGGWVYMIQACAA